MLLEIVITNLSRVEGKEILSITGVLRSNYGNEDREKIGCREKACLMFSFGVFSLLRARQRGEEKDFKACCFSFDFCLK